jgi:hypothetical protein
MHFVLHPVALSCNPLARVDVPFFSSSLIKLTCEKAYLFAIARDHFSSIRNSVCRSSIRFVAVDVAFTEAPDPVAESESRHLPPT